MKNANLRPWYKQKRYLLLTGLIFYTTALGVGGNPQSVQSNPITPQIEIPTVRQQTQKPQTIENQAEPVTKAKTSPTLSNSNHYTNTYGNEVHSPTYTEDGSIPAGASAQCRDGTYSFSQSRRGTCSHHGGVATWL